MPRPAEFTDEQIRSAIGELAKAGNRLSAFAIRRVLGGGNMTRIAAVLADWQDNHKPADEEPQTIDLPAELREEVEQRMADLSASLSGVIGRIHRRATEIAESRVAEAVKAARAAAEAAEVELADARAVLAESDVAQEALQQDRDRLARLVAEVEQRERQAREEAAELRGKGTAQAEEITRLGALVTDLQARERQAVERAAKAEGRLRTKDNG